MGPRRTGHNGCVCIQRLHHPSPHPIPATFPGQTAGQPTLNQEARAEPRGPSLTLGGLRDVALERQSSQTICKFGL